MDETIYTEVIACPLCGHHDNRAVFEETFKIKGKDVVLGINECASCQLCYVSPRLNLNGLSLLYNAEYMEQTVAGIYNVCEKVSEGKYRQFVEYLNNELPQGGAVLDVGCGVGLMLDAIAANCPQLSTQGIEFSEFAAQKARGKGYQVRSGDITKMADLEPGMFDAIIIIDVLEHVPNPIAVMDKCHALLKEGGKVLLSVPNYRYLKLSHTGILSRLLFGKPSNLFSNEHLFNYTPKTIASVLNKSGFQILFWGQAKPLKAGSIVHRILKSVFSLIFDLLFKCGFHLGGIHIIAGKVSRQL